ncbi:flagellar type III secretion system pore protein FliP [Edaphobacter sp.]|uniref:flagellar type III secretion system pore protein FliP n=1 Tax=Edaphobacter sp. TaxID=1934404 RepID=UPI002DBB3B34|nr:flagellar type III secretion system pore protein FliP [Edaphobacter sp.]HEU5342637.1 flagellar type III secretion system pore protein FliP [Edaphobacter sp.]
MPVGHRLRRAALWMALLMAPVCAVHAQSMARGAGSGARSAADVQRLRVRNSGAAGDALDAGNAAAPSRNGSIEDALKANRSVPWAIVLGLTLLTLLPALLLAMTPMVRLLVVFHFLRQALGTQTAPSNQVLMGLALMMTWFLMQPVLLDVQQTAVAPYSAGTISGPEAIERGMVPVKKYMLRYAREKDLAVFASAGLATQPKSREDLPMQVVVPAYILSELKAGFEIGAILFLPFLLVDLVVASVTTSIGMMQLPPVVISTPLKILLFVMVDGWRLLADQLIKSF